MWLFPAHLENKLTPLTAECQAVREEQIKQRTHDTEKLDNLRSLVRCLQGILKETALRLEILVEEKESTAIASHMMVNRARCQLVQERRHTASLMFVIHSQVLRMLSSWPVILYVPSSATMLTSRSIAPRKYCDTYLIKMISYDMMHQKIIIASMQM